MIKSRLFCGEFTSVSKVKQGHKKPFPPGLLTRVTAENCSKLDTLPGFHTNSCPPKYNFGGLKSCRIMPRSDLVCSIVLNADSDILVRVCVRCQHDGLAILTTNIKINIKNLIKLRQQSKSVTKDCHEKNFFLT